MGFEEWTEESIDISFQWRQTASQEGRDQRARSVIRASSIHPVGMHGSLSYASIAATETIISFRIADGDEAPHEAAASRPDCTSGEPTRYQTQPRHYPRLREVPRVSTTQLPGLNMLLDETTVSVNGDPRLVAGPHPAVRHGALDAAPDFWQYELRSWYRAVHDDKEDVEALAGEEQEEPEVAAADTPKGP
ncbi:hypothetical protein DL766_004899 [Monosporascus sp. MC13-8B]|uniref:Uncharacterized protein n=1 Tax=Monosporascus cannonballus TaxID=155416 RepID=A0ABY0HCR0_9PEZI|nr:hypothetical protein DL763_010900 [Monosporascus cannonballus]RYO90053.1 hypothetical protein DL762_002898 [Monosporascus cannonballus]RYP30354.1 hypothetical protein DL766_004899 [Monosporascus sp. MC13-8B]